MRTGPLPDMLTPKSPHPEGWMIDIYHHLLCSLKATHCVEVIAKQWVQKQRKMEFCLQDREQSHLEVCVCLCAC